MKKFFLKIYYIFGALKIWFCETFFWFCAWSELLKNCLFSLDFSFYFFYISPKSPGFTGISQYRHFLRLKIAKIRRLAIYRQLIISIAIERPKIADLAKIRQKWQHCCARAKFLFSVFAWLRDFKINLRKKLFIFIKM